MMKPETSAERPYNRFWSKLACMLVGTLRSAWQRLGLEFHHSGQAHTIQVIFGTQRNRGNHIITVRIVIEDAGVDTAFFALLQLRFVRCYAATVHYLKIIRRGFDSY